MNNTQSIYVVKWGYSMILADFFVLLKVSKNKFIALKLPKEERQEGIRQEYAMPIKDIPDLKETYPVRIKDMEIEIKYASQYRKAYAWDGKPVSIDTYD